MSPTYGKQVARSLVIVQLLAVRGPLKAAAIHRAVLASLTGCTEAALEDDEAAETMKAATGWTDRTFRDALDLAASSQAIWCRGRSTDATWEASQAVRRVCPCGGGSNN